MLTLRDIAVATTGQWLLQPQDEKRRVSIESDSRRDCSQACFIAFCGERFDAHDFLIELIDSGAAALCIHRTPGRELLEAAEEKSIPVLLVKDTVKAYQQMATEMLRIHSKCNVLGVTGSSGKTSVKSILASLLEVAYPQQVLSTLANTNNHIGVPQNVLRLHEKHRFAVLELGTNHPGEIAVLAQCITPQIAIITSIGNSHGGNFPEKNGILQEKCEILRYMKGDGMAFIPFEMEKEILELGFLDGRNYRTFGADSQADISYEYLGGKLHGSSCRMVIGDVSLEVTTSLSGRHQIQNLALCLGVMSYLECELAPLESAVKHLTLPGMRMKVMDVAGIQVINDAYNANPQSTAALLQWLADITDEFSGERYVVLGDMLELGDESESFHRNILECLPAKWNVIVVGPYYTAALAENGKSFANATAAAEWLKEKLKTGDVLALKGSRGMKLETIIDEIQD